MNRSTTPRSRTVPAITRPASVVVAAIRTSHRSTIQALLQQAGLPSAPAETSAEPLPWLQLEDPAGPMEEWPGWLAENPQAHMILVVPLPSIAVARDLGEGMAPKAALAGWLASAQSALELIRRQRRRVSLVFAEPALAQPQSFLNTIAQRLQLSLDTAQPRQAPLELPGGVLRMMAENAILQSSEARNLVAELEANALPLADDGFNHLPAIDQVFSEYRKSIDTKAQAARELREENNLLLDQLQRVQQKMEAFSTEKRSIEQRLSSAEQYKAELEKTRQKLEQVRLKAQSVEELKEENELLLVQLHQVQEELESQLLQSKQAEEKLAAAAPNKQAQLKDLEEENELLLQQLHHVQEELEHYYLQSTQINSQQLEDLQQRLHAAEETVAALYNSKSWKITKPLRVTLDLFTGGSKTG